MVATATIDSRLFIETTTVTGVDVTPTCSRRAGHILGTLCTQRARRSGGYDRHAVAAVGSPTSGHPDELRAYLYCDQLNAGCRHHKWRKLRG